MAGSSGCSNCCSSCCSSNSSGHSRSRRTRSNTMRGRNTNTRNMRGRRNRRSSRPNCSKCSHLRCHPRRQRRMGETRRTGRGGPRAVRRAEIGKDAKNFLAFCFLRNFAGMKGGGAAIWRPAAPFCTRSPANLSAFLINGLGNGECPDGYFCLFWPKSLPIFDTPSPFNPSQFTANYWRNSITCMHAACSPWTCWIPASLCRSSSWQGNILRLFFLFLVCACLFRYPSNLQFVAWPWLIHR